MNMSRLSKEFKIGEKTVSVYELTVKDIKKLWQDLTGSSEQTKDMPMFSNEQILRDHWDKCVHGIKLEETDELAPSELKLVYDAFSEVNAIFFDLTLKLEGENPFLKSLRAAILNDLMLRFAVLSAEATKESGTTDTVSSLPPLKKA
jgi:hypothetical protein